MATRTVQVSASADGKRKAHSRKIRVPDGQATPVDSDAADVDPFADGNVEIRTEGGDVIDPDCDMVFDGPEDFFVHGGAGRTFTVRNGACVEFGLPLEGDDLGAEPVTVNVESGGEAILDYGRDFMKPCAANVTARDGSSVIVKDCGKSNVHVTDSAVLQIGGTLVADGESRVLETSLCDVTLNGQTLASGGIMDCDVTLNDDSRASYIAGSGVKASGQSKAHVVDCDLDVSDSAEVWWSAEEQDEPTGTNVKVSGDGKLHVHHPDNVALDASGNARVVLYGNGGHVRETGERVHVERKTLRYFRPDRTLR